jgi:hypothetical protein
MAQLPRDGADDDGLAPKDGNPGDHRHRGEDRHHQEGDRAPLDRNCSRRRQPISPALATHRISSLRAATAFALLGLDPGGEA